MVIGWDIGGVNTKMACVVGGQILDVRSRPFELQQAPAALESVLRDLVLQAGAPSRPPGISAAGPAFGAAVTMTAELSQIFRRKRDGVAFVLDAVAAAFPGAAVRVFAADGRFLAPDEARRAPLAVAAANWAATAHMVASSYPDALLVDIGSTTTDIIPIVGGRVAARGWTDPDRLASGELVYTGALRTPVEAIVREVPYGAGTAAVSAEGFALIGDVHVWRGALDAAHFTVATPDGRPATREFAGERIARVICADTDLLDEVGVSRIADAVASAQVSLVAASIQRVRTRHPALHTAVVAGLGAFIGDAAAQAEGLAVVHLASQVGSAAARCAPAAAVALLLEREIGRD